MKNNPIIQRFYIKGKLVVLSPLLIGSGEDEHTDMDIIRDAEGNPFIPGASLAGGLRRFLRSRLDDENDDEQPIIKTLFGKTEKDSTLSLLMISDSLPQENSGHHVMVRDGLKIDYSTRTVGKHTDKHDDPAGGAKYDYEVIEPGASFILKMELVIRENNRPDIDKIYDAAAFLLKHLEKGSLRVGAKTRRGMGQIQLEDTAILKLDMKYGEDVETWIAFDWNRWNFQPNITLDGLTTNMLPFITPPRFTISAAFTIPYSLLIRHYNADPSDEDNTQLMSNGKYVIPGTSWNGALRHAIHSQLNCLTGNKKRVDEIIEKMFGIVEEKKTHASRVMIEESIIEKERGLNEKDQAVSYTRNKVDRFTGGVVESALFTEKPVYRGSVSLNITLENPEEWEKGVLLLALRDMANGIQPVGGAANIGRGILQTDYPCIKVDHTPLTREIEGTYFKSLYIHLKNGETNG
jgi:CRISPR/Cas system CSM-associated protein Csm3 (group 7 of RAMP superfamily)